MATLQSFRGHKREDFVKGDISQLLFRHDKTQQACHLFLDWLKKNRNEATPSEISQFAKNLQDGMVTEGFRYQRKSFYQTILRRLVDLGFVAKQTRYRGIAYAPVIQPIPKRAPVMTSWWGFAYLVAEKWNREFEK